MVDMETNGEKKRYPPFFEKHENGAIMSNPAPAVFS